MIIIYHCWAGCHSSVTAASIHLGLLPMDRIPAKEEFLNIRFYDHQWPEDHGKIYRVGTDEFGNTVCFMGREFCGDIVTRALTGIGSLYNIRSKDLLFVDAMQCANILMMLGGSISRALRWISVGRPVVIRGTQRSYKQIISLVEQVKQQIAK